MKEIKNKILNIRGKQVMLDSDLAELYQIPTFRLNQAVKRNIDRFPEDFMFQLTKEEFEILISQFAISNYDVLNPENQPFESKSLTSQIVISTAESLKTQNNKVSENKGGRTYLPYVFTEQGVAMLSGILRSEVAIKVNIQIMRAFIQMRNFLQTNSEIFSRLDKNEKKLLTHDNKIEEIFNLIQEKDIKPEKGIFYDGEIFDAYKFINDLIKNAKEEIILIDNYIDESVLTLFSKTKVNVIIYTKEINKQLKLDLDKYNQQYNNINVIQFNKSHDRFLIIDRKEIYHIGASLNHLGKRWFAFSKFEDLSILDRIIE
jgi:hypothetical protein